MAFHLAWMCSVAVRSMWLRLDARRFCSATSPLVDPRATELPLPALGPKPTNAESKRDVTCDAASDMDTGWGLEGCGLCKHTCARMAADASHVSVRSCKCLIVSVFCLKTAMNLDGSVACHSSFH